MKRLIIFALTLCMIFCSISIAFANENQLSLVIAADTHFVPSDSLGDVSLVKNTDSELFGHATTQGQQTYESEAILTSFLNEFIASQSDILLIAGDLTNGKRNSHINLARHLKNAESHGKRVFVINGNHDIAAVSSEDKIDYTEFKEIYKDFGYSEALALDESSCSYTVKLDEKHRLLAIDSCEYGKDEGKIISSRLSFINEQIKAAKNDGVELIAMMHHSALKHYNLQKLSDIAGSSADSFAKLLAKSGIRLIFTGHIHGNDISSVKDNDSTLYDVMTGSLITYPNSYRKVTISDKTEISTDYITEIDTSLLPAGYNDSQLQLISNDYPSYSRGYLTFGMKFWMDRNLGSSYKIRRMLDLDIDSSANKQIDSFMAKLGDAINLPIYGEENSLEATAKAFGGSIPKSDYSYVYEIVGTVVAHWYQGDETDKSQEIDLLISCVKYILADFLGSLSDTSRKSLEGAFNIDFPSKDYVKLADGILRAILKPVLRGITGDLTAPGDVNIIIEHTQTATKKSILQIFFDRLLSFLQKALAILSIFKL